MADRNLLPQAHEDDARAAAPAPRPAAGPWPIVAAIACAALVVMTAAHFIGLAPDAPAVGVTVRPSSTFLTQVRDISRLETTELHLERVIDLSDRQQRLFGLVETTDAILLVAAGDVVIGIDLSRLSEGDVAIDPETGIARLRLPAPEILSSRLDEKKTYVYTRTTELLARRNEQLEARARKEALAAIERGAREADVTARAKAQAERQLRALAMGFGAKELEITWR